MRFKPGQVIHYRRDHDLAFLRGEAREVVGVYTKETEPHPNKFGCQGCDPVKFPGDIWNWEHNFEGFILPLSRLDQEANKRIHDQRVEDEARVKAWNTTHGPDDPVALLNKYGVGFLFNGETKGSAQDNKCRATCRCCGREAKQCWEGNVATVDNPLRLRWVQQDDFTGWMRMIYPWVESRDNATYIPREWVSICPDCATVAYPLAVNANRPARGQTKVRP